jgi:hypothetical protein
MSEDKVRRKDMCWSVRIFSGRRDVTSFPVEKDQNSTKKVEKDQNWKTH